MNNRSRPWEVAADLEAAAKAVVDAGSAISAIHPSAWGEIFEDESVSLFDVEAERIANALQALSDKYQAIADAEPDGPECPSSPTRNHIVDTTMESGPNNCFHCERPMP